jgi:CheY-like chemotaxis protein
LKTALIITDDNELCSDILEIIELEQLSVNVAIAQSGLEGLEILRSMSKPPELIITDNLMPDLTGAKLLQKLRTSQGQHFAHVPVVLMTSFPPSELRKYLTHQIGDIRPDSVLYKTNILAIVEIMQRYLV